MNEWIKLIDEATCENGIVETLHEDGVIDIAKMVNGVIYEHDKKTNSPMVAFRSIKNPFVSTTVTNTEEK